jgi:hypothetical protein
MKVALNNFIFTAAIGIPLILVSLISSGTQSNKLLTSGIGVVIFGAIVSLYYWKKGKKADQECDERENYIVEKSMKCTFYITAVAIQFLWALSFTGYKGDFLFILMAVFWGSFLAFYMFNRFKV